MSSRQPPNEPLLMRLNLEQLDRINREPTLIRPTRLVVTRQIPPAGSVVPRGTTVQVVLTDLGQIPIEVFQPDVPESLKGVKLAEIERVVEASPTLKQTVASTAPVNPTEAVQQINATGLTKTQLQGQDAVKAITAFRTVLR